LISHLAAHFVMPQHPMSGPGESKAARSATDTFRAQPKNESFETDLGDLTARFAALGGSPELSTDLALQIVLNEIVEQACLATGATGAAIALEREGEMVCRATSGSTAPELGSRLDTAAGLSGLCFKTHETQRSDDVLADERADLAASQRLGVRSVIVIPLLQGAELVGVFEAFSALPFAFGEREEGTLEVLAGRALSNLERSVQPAPLEMPAPVSETATEGESESADDTSEQRIDFATWSLRAAVAACAVLLAVMLGLHFMMPRAAARRHSAAPVAAKAAPAVSAQTPDATPDTSSSETNRASNTAVGGSEHAESASPQTTRVKSSATGAVPPGGLSIYENGKEVFRMVPEEPADQGVTDSSPDSSQKSAVLPAASIEPDDVTSDGVTRLSAGAVDADLVRRVEPDYPEEARQQGIQGAVVLDVRAGRDGLVQHINLISGPPSLVEAAIAAVSQWQFKPHLVKGHAVGIETRVTLNFRLPQ
jgi:TonB family protein